MTGNGALESAGGALPVRRPNHKRPYALMISPLRLHAWPLLAKRPAAAVFVTDPERVPEIPPQHLSRLFGLTPAEARLAAALAGRRTVQEYAEQTGVTTGTARWTLKRVLEKTGCCRQSELVLLLVTTLAAYLF